MPMVWSADADHINGWVFNDIKEVAYNFAVIIFVRFIYEASTCRSSGFVAIAYGDDFYVVCISFI
jgi:hypothetical protein